MSHVYELWKNGEVIERGIIDRVNEYEVEAIFEKIRREDAAKFKPRVAGHGRIRKWSEYTYDYYRIESSARNVLATIKIIPNVE